MSRIFGAVCQNGYVVRDIRAAMDHWVNVMGVRPWYYIDRLLPSPGPGLRHRDEHIDRAAACSDHCDRFKGNDGREQTR